MGAVVDAIEEALLRAISLEPHVALFEHFFAIDIITRRKPGRRRRPVSRAQTTSMLRAPTCGDCRTSVDSRAEILFG